MPENDEPRPTDPEIEAQLHRMLSSNRFKGAPNRHMVLEYIVKSKLRGVSINEEAIGTDLFPQWEPESDDVRVSVSNLRKTLKDYYEAEGADDLVIIEVPKGAAYVPTFTYNPRGQDYQTFLLAQHLLRRISAQDFSQAMTKAGEPQGDPLYAPILKPNLALAHAEAILLYQITVAGQTQHTLIRYVGFVARKALDVQPDWEGFVLLGAANLFLHQFAEASRNFRQACKLSDHSTERNGWYWAYLMAFGQFKKAIGLIERAASETPNQAHIHLLHGLWLYALRRFDEATAAVSRALLLDRNSPIPHAVLGAISLAQVNDAGAALQHIRRSGTLDIDSSGAVEPSFGHRFNSGLAAVAVARRISQTEHPDRRKMLLKELRDIFSDIVSAQSSSFFDRALLVLAVNGLSPDDLVVVATSRLPLAVLRSCEPYDPRALWVRLWPVFDPLHSDPEFQRIIDEFYPQPSSDSVL